jgi:hypothetical protein
MDTKITLNQDALAGRYSVRYRIHESHRHGGGHISDSYYWGASLEEIISKIIEAHVAAVRALHHVKTKKRSQVSPTAP